MGMLVMLGFLSVFAVRVVGPGPCFLLLPSCHAGFVSVTLLKMPVKKDVASSSAAGQSGKGVSGEVHVEKSVDKLNGGSSANASAFRMACPFSLWTERPYRLRNPRTTLSTSQGAIQCWAPVPSPILVQRISLLHPDPLSLHPSQHSPGADGVQHYEYAV